MTKKFTFLLCILDIGNKVRLREAQTPKGVLHLNLPLKLSAMSDDKSLYVFYATQTILVTESSHTLFIKAT